MPPAAPFVIVREPLELPRRLQWSSLDVSLRYLACGTRTGAVFLFNRRGGYDSKTLSLDLIETTHASAQTPVTCLKFSPDERLLAVASSTGEMCIIELNLESVRKKPRIVQKHMPDKDCRDRSSMVSSPLEHVTSMCWDRTSSQLFVGTSGGVVARVDMPKHKKASSQSLSGLSKIQSFISSATSPTLTMLCAMTSRVVQLELAPHLDAQEIIISTLEQCVYLHLNSSGGVPGGNNSNPIKGESGDGGRAACDSSADKATTNSQEDSDQMQGAEAAEDAGHGRPIEAHRSSGNSALEKSSVGSIPDKLGAPTNKPMQIGKKKRNGAYGACYCSATDLGAQVAFDQLMKEAEKESKSSGACEVVKNIQPSLLYAARPGRRIWIANARDQKVLCTLSLKKKMASEPSLFLGSARPESVPQISKGNSKLEFSKLAAFRTNAGRKAPSRDILLSWSTSGDLFFINTDISNPDSVRVLQWHNELGTITDLVVCGRECVEANSALFALHGSTDTSQPPQLSRIISLHPLSFLESYLADTVPVLDCIKLALEHNILSLSALERLELRLRGRGMRKRGSEEEEHENAKMLTKFVELMSGLRAEIGTRNLTSVEQGRNVDVDVGMDTHTEDESELITESVSSQEDKEQHPGNLEGDQHDVVTKSGQDDQLSNQDCSTVPPLSISSLSEIELHVSADWDNRDKASDDGINTPNAKARRRYRVLSLAFSQQERLSLPEDIPEDVVSQKDLAAWFLQLNEHIKYRDRSIVSTGRDEHTALSGEAVATKHNIPSDTNPSVSPESPLASSQHYPSWDSPAVMAPISLSVDNVGAAYTTTTPSEDDKSRKRDRKKKRKKRRDRIASVADLEVDVDVSFNNREMTTQKDQSGEQQNHEKQKRVAKLAKGALTRAVGVASNAKQAAVKALDNMTKTIDGDSLRGEKQAHRQKNLNSVVLNKDGAATQEDDPSMTVSEAIQRLQEKQATVPWSKLRPAGLSGSYPGGDYVGNIDYEEEDAEAIAAAKEARDIAADPSLKNLDKWLKKRQNEERMKSNNSASLRQHVELETRNMADHKNTSLANNTVNQYNHEESGLHDSNEGISSLVGGTMDYLVRNIGGGVVETMASIASGVSATATTLGTDSSWISSDSANSLDGGIPSGAILRGKQNAVVECASDDDSVLVSIPEEQEDVTELHDSVLYHHVCKVRQSIGIHTASTVQLSQQFSDTIMRGEFSNPSGITRDVTTVLIDRMCTDGTAIDTLLSFLDLHKSNIDVESCLFAVARRTPSSAKLIFQVLSIFESDSLESISLEHLQRDTHESNCSSLPSLLTLLRPGLLVDFLEGCLEGSDEFQFILDTTVALCEYVGIQILIYLTFSRAQFSSFSGGSVLDSLPWHNPDWLSLVLDNNESRRPAIERFLRAVLRQIFVGYGGMGSIPCEQKTKPGVALKLFSRKTKAIVHAWIYLETQEHVLALKAISPDETSYNEHQEHKLATTEFATLERFLASLECCAHPFASRYQFDHLWLAQQLVDVGYVNGLIILLGVMKIQYESLSIQFGMQNELHKLQMAISAVAAQAAELAAANNYFDKLGDVFEIVANVVDPSALVTLMMSPLTAYLGGEHTEVLIKLKKAISRGILCSLGAERAISIFDYAGSAFWADLPSNVFDALVVHEERRKKRQACIIQMAVDVDKYLWSQKSEVLPSRLRALRLCEESLRQTPGLRQKIMDRIPVRAHRLFNKQKQDTEVSEIAAYNTSMGLQTFHDDADDQWGIVIPIVSRSDQRGLDHQLDNFLPCQASGLFMESGRSVSIFPCGHMVLAERSSYGACPCCPILKRREDN